MEQRRALIADALEAARQAVVELPPAVREMVARPIAAARVSLATHEDPSEVLDEVRAAARVALVQATEGHSTHALLAALARAQQGAMAPATACRHLQAAPAYEPRDELRVATRGVPTTIRVMRALAWPDAHGADPSSDAITTLRLDPIARHPSDDFDTEDDDHRPPSVPPPAQPPSDDWGDDEAVLADLPVVQWNPGLRVIAVDDFHAKVVREAIDVMAAMEKLRDTGPWSERGEPERRMLVLSDAILVAGVNPLAAIVDAWRGAADVSPYGYCSHAAAFALARFAGPDALSQVLLGLSQLGPDATHDARKAAEALGVVDHPDMGSLARDLLESSHPVARATGVSLAASRGDLDTPRLRDLVLEPSPAVMGAAIDAIGHHTAEAAQPFHALLQRWLRFPDEHIAWRATVALLGTGDRTPYEEVRRGGALLRQLGPLALEIFALAGDLEDRGRVAKIASGLPADRRMLSAIGRYGHPEAWSFLVHYLEDEDLGDAALDALVTLYGARVDEDHAGDPSAWRVAIADAQLDAGVRYRRGRPWSPAVVADELTEGSLDRRAIELRVLELRVRTGAIDPIDLSAWGANASGPLTALATRARTLTWSSEGW